MSFSEGLRLSGQTAGDLLTIVFKDELPRLNSHYGSKKHNAAISATIVIVGTYRLLRERNFLISN